MSDFHAGAFNNEQSILRSIATINAEKPDLVALVGDYIDAHNNVEKRDYIFDALKKLQPPLGVYAVLGNHDHWIDAEYVQKKLQELPAVVLNNEGLTLDNGIGVAGVDDLLESHAEGESKRGPLTDNCLHCHSTDYRHAPEGEKPDLKSARFGVTCVACHEPHGRDKNRPGFGDGAAVCGACHVQTMANKERRHTPCPTGQVGCADCHMPLIVKSGGFLSLRSHAFRIIPPEASKGSKMPNSCQNGDCHAERDLEWAIAAYEDFYPKEQ